MCGSGVQGLVDKKILATQRGRKHCIKVVCNISPFENGFSTEKEEVAGEGLAVCLPDCMYVYICTYT